MERDVEAPTTAEGASCALAGLAGTDRTFQLAQEVHGRRTLQVRQIFLDIARLLTGAERFDLTAAAPTA